MWWLADIGEKFDISLISNAIIILIDFAQWNTKTPIDTRGKNKMVKNETQFLHFVVPPMTTLTKW